MQQIGNDNGLIERGRGFPKPENLEPIAKVLNVPLKELFDFEKTRYFPPAAANYGSAPGCEEAQVRILLARGTRTSQLHGERIVRQDRINRTVRS
jgi:transcriptional regulator with XRE-family HTH domain